jgi:tripartite-type tricarboxylate transporter receptor subunit TctC
MLHVPYKGGGPLLTDLLGGQIMVALSGLLTAPQFEKSGKLRVLGHTGGHRLASWPDMPTIAEGIPGFELVGWFALFATGGTPADIITRLNTETVRALQLPDIRKRITDSGAQVIASSARELKDFVERELYKYSKLVRAANIQAE